MDRMNRMNESFNSSLFFISHANANATLRSTRTNNLAKAFTIAMNSPKPVNITVWTDYSSKTAAEETHVFYPTNFICTTKDEVFRAFSVITGGSLP